MASGIRQAQTGIPALELITHLALGRTAPSLVLRSSPSKWRRYTVSAGHLLQYMNLLPSWTLTGLLLLG